MMMASHRKPEIDNGLGDREIEGADGGDRDEGLELELGADIDALLLVFGSTGLGGVVARLLSGAVLRRLGSQHRRTGQERLSHAGSERHGHHDDDGDHQPNQQLALPH